MGELSYIDDFSNGSLMKTVSSGILHLLSWGLLTYFETNEIGFKDP